MRYIVFLALFTLAACKPAVQSDEKENWIQLFNGNDLEDWDIKFTGYPLNENYKNTFRVENGNMIASYDEWEDFNGEFGHIFYNKPFLFWDAYAISRRW